MQLAWTERFKKACRRLTLAQQEAAKKALQNLTAHGVRYPALRVKRIRGTANIWEGRVSQGCRMTFQFDGETLLLRNVGEYDAALDRP
jgi:mRNA-degrading endonuclease RelE of RelBE toxin-antitoxin system